MAWPRRGASFAGTGWSSSSSRASLAWTGARWTPRPRPSNTPSRRAWSRPSPPTWASRWKTRTAIPSPRPRGPSPSATFGGCTRSTPASACSIREVQDDSPERLRRWQALGLMPGVTVVFLRHQPLDDLFELRIGDRVVPAGQRGTVRAAGGAGRRRRADGSLTRYPVTLRPGRRARNGKQDNRRSPSSRPVVAA